MAQVQLAPPPIERSDVIVNENIDEFNARTNKKAGGKSKKKKRKNKKERYGFSNYLNDCNESIDVFCKLGKPDMNYIIRRMNGTDADSMYRGDTAMSTYGEDQAGINEMLGMMRNTLE
jgi:hypothetical protein